MPTYISFGTSVGQNIGNGKVHGLKLGTRTLTPANLWCAIQSPRDIATGQASGKRQHEPITITKEWDAASPQLLNSLVNGKVLPEIHFNFWRATAQGTTQPYITITLTNASLARYTRNPIPLHPPRHTHSGIEDMEEIGFTYQAIEWKWGSGGVTVSEDDWEAAA